MREGGVCRLWKYLRVSSTKIGGCVLFPAEIVPGADASLDVGNFHFFAIP